MDTQYSIQRSVNEFVETDTFLKAQKLQRLGELHLPFTGHFSLRTVTSKAKKFLKLMEENNFNCMHWENQSPSVGWFISEDDSILLIARGFNKLTGNHIAIEIYTKSHAQLVETTKWLKKKIAKLYNVMNEENAYNLAVKLYYIGTNGLTYKHVSEDFSSDIFYPEAYSIDNLQKQIDEYLTSDSQILILMGPPGTGKTRLIRQILRQKVDHDEAMNISIAERITLRGIMYTSGEEPLTHDEVYNQFIDSSNIWVIEDLDRMLSKREEGNISMSKILNISDGILTGKMKKKKIIITTNLGKLSHMDQALLRPGRCHGVWKIDILSAFKATQLARRLGNEEITFKTSKTVAEVFAAVSGQGYHEATTVGFGPSRR